MIQPEAISSLVHLGKNELCSLSDKEGSKMQKRAWLHSLKTKTERGLKTPKGDGILDFSGKMRVRTPNAHGGLG